MNALHATGTETCAANTFEVTDAQLELLQRGTLEIAAEDLRAAASNLDHLRIYSPWSAVASSDAQGSIRLARESLDLLDRLGWPASFDEPQSCGWCERPIEDGRPSVQIAGVAGHCPRVYHAGAGRDCFAEVHKAIELAQQLDRSAS